MASILKATTQEVKGDSDQRRKRRDGPIEGKRIWSTSFSCSPFSRKFVSVF